MKLFFKVLSTFFALYSVAQAQNARDSVGVFHRPEKVVVLVTERGSHGRIENFMNAVTNEDTLFLKNQDESLQIRCGKSPKESSCTFRFQPSDSVYIGDKSVQGVLPMLTQNQYETSFESSMGDKFILKVTAHGLHFWAGKKGSRESHE